MDLTIGQAFEQCEVLDESDFLHSISVPATLEFHALTVYQWITPGAEYGLPPGNETGDSGPGPLTGNLIYNPQHTIRLTTPFPAVLIAPPTLTGAFSGQVVYNTDRGGGDLHASNINVAISGNPFNVHTTLNDVTIQASTNLAINAQADIGMSVLPISIVQVSAPFQNQFYPGTTSITTTKLILHLQAPVLTRIFPHLGGIWGQP
jgi:hypothetical protein